MNIRIIAAISAAFLLSAVGWGEWRHHAGWRDGRAAMVAAQSAAAQVEYALKLSRQHATEAQAAAADTTGKQEAQAITKEVIRYVKTADRSRCTFDVERVRIKQRAAANANTLAGFDD